MSLFSVNNGAYSRKNKNILQGIEFDISRGEILSVLGCNGVGKTTFLKCCMGLLNWIEGESLLFGKNIKQISDLWKSISYVPQAKDIHIGIKVLDMVLLGCNPFLKLAPKGEHYDKAMQTLQRLKIDYLADNYCHCLSGGELQMVLFARALVSEPLMLVLDEPESNLDIKNQLIILDILQDLSLSGVAILLNTHYPNHAFRISKKSLLLYREEGNPKCIYGNTKDVLNQENLSKVFDVSSHLFKHTYLDF